MISNLFGTGPNICKEKENNKNIVMSGLIMGILITILIFGFVTFNVEKYLLFMNFEIEIYKNFTIYSIIILGISAIFNILLMKLYFNDKENIASKYCFIFNFLNLICLTFSSIITKNQILSIIFTILILLIYVIYLFIKLFEKFKFKFSFIDSFKYEANTICSNIIFFLIFLFGLKNANSFAPEYITTINFLALITDTQWDSLEAICTIAKIDISKNRFNYKEHLINGYKLTGIMGISIFVLLLTLYKFYNVQLPLAFLYLSFELINFSIYSRYIINLVIIQLEISSVKATIIKIIANVLRFVISCLPTPFCTAIGQATSSLFQFVFYEIILKRKKYFKNIK